MKHTSLLWIHLVITQDIFSCQETSKNRGVDCIVEMLSNVNLQKDLDIVSVNGTIVVSSI